MYKDEVKKYYDYTLPLFRIFWHGNTRAIHYGIWDVTTKNLHEALLNTNKVLADLAVVKSGDRVLDAGCGVGGSAFWLAKNRNAHVTGITISEKQLAKARELAKRLHFEQQTEFYLQDYTNTNFEDDSFDVVWAIESVCYAENKAVFLQEAQRLLRRGPVMSRQSLAVDESLSSRYFGSNTLRFLKSATTIRNIFLERIHSTSV